MGERTVYSVEHTTNSEETSVLVYIVARVVGSYERS